MSTDYSKKKNAELVEILKGRSLPHTGNKADMVARLQEDDKLKAAKKSETAEDVIDWEDDAPMEATSEVKPSTEAGAAAIAAGGKGSVPNPVAVPNQVLATNPATTDDLKVEALGFAHDVKAQVTKPAAVPPAKGEHAAGAPKKGEKPAVDYSRGLAATEFEEELKKRKARAEKFGILETSQPMLEEAEKVLQRSKRFGSGVEANPAVGVKGLDEALPDERSSKRRRGDNDNNHRGNKRRNFGGRNRNRRAGDGGRSRNQRENNGAEEQVWSEKDLLAMEARKKRFATAA